MIVRERRFWAAVWRYVRTFPAHHPLYCVVILTVVVLVGTAKWQEAAREAYKNSPEGRAEIARQNTEMRAQANHELDQMMAEVDLAGLKVWLRDPKSAQFTDVRTFQRAGKRVTCGYVNSHNGFGGMAGPQAFAVIDYQVNLANVGPNAAKAVRAACGRS